MGDNGYRYLFPFEKVPYKSSVLIYGAGIMGMEYLKQLNITEYCNVVGMVDKNAKEYNLPNIIVYDPSQIHMLQFDYVVVALRSGRNYQEVLRVLSKEGVDKDKIICIYERKVREFSVLSDVQAKQEEMLAVNLSEVSVALLLSGGMGDMVVIKRFVQEIIRFLPECKIDIYYSNMGEFLKYLYSDCDNINEIIPDLGQNYNMYKKQYTIAMDIVSTRYVHVNNLQEEKLQSINEHAYEIMMKLKEQTEKEGIDLNTQMYLIYMRRMYKGVNAYTAFGFNGIFDISDNSVSIPLPETAGEVFKSMGLRKYITVNYGVGSTEDAEKNAKSWPYEYMCAFIKQFKAKYDNIRIVQLGGNNARKLQHADDYLFGLDFSVVSHVLNNSIFHLDIEGGLVHIASQLGTKCFVLFGQTPLRYFAYDSNTNICVGDCQGCYGMYKDGTVCAREMEEPECMYSITPDKVMTEVDKYMVEVGYL